MATKTTDELLKMLKNVHTRAELENYTSELSEQKSYSTFHSYMADHLRAHQLAESDVVRESMIPRTYAYQILNGTKNPGRDKAIALCLAARMNYEETQRALALAGQGKLYPRRKRDSVLIFAAEQGIGVQQANELLFSEGEEILA